jgi:hypothetical protein
MTRNERPSDGTVAVFIAAFSGPCGLCETRIEPGDEAAFVDDEVCHADCARDAATA